MDLLNGCKEACEFFAVVKEEKIFQLIMQKWSVLEEVMQILEIAAITTNVLQSTSFTLSDFFGSWLKMKLKLQHKISNENLTTNFARIFHEKILLREKELLRYPAMLCAIYLDRRYKQELKKAEDIAIAKYALANLYERISSNRQKPQQQQDECELDSFEQYLSKNVSVMNESDESIVEHEFNRLDFMEKLKVFDEKFERINHKQSVLQDWETLKADHPEVYTVACIINGIPPTQVTVERSFSAMAFIFNPKRAKLGHTMLENILMIKLNRELVQSINDRDLKALVI